MDIHLKGFKALGADISIEHGFVQLQAKQLKGTEINFDFPSVGATENIMMAAVKQGADRQEAHEAVRQHSVAAAEVVKSGGENDLLERLGGDPMFSGLDLSDVLDPSRYVGTCPEQVTRFIEAVAGPVRNRWKDRLSDAVDLGI